MNFTYFKGNENVKRRISALFASSRLPHAILIEGENGLGKKTLAREIACALVCRSGADKPCYACSQCVKALKGVHPDIYEYCAPGSANSFHISTVRSVIKDCAVIPNEADYKVYILANAHCMNNAAQNALLKILEEPPAYAVFILTAQNRSAMLETILSRVVCVSVQGVSPEEGAQIVVSQNSDVSFEEARSAVLTFGGNVGKALESLAGGKFEEMLALADGVCGGIAGGSEYELLKTLSPLVSSRQDTAALLAMLKTVFRDALAGGEALSGRVESVKLLRRSFTRKKLLGLFEASEALYDMALKNANQQLLITKICCTLREAAGR